MTPTRRHTLRTILLLVFAAWNATASAQNNPYKIKDALYPLYRKAFANRTKPEGLLMADTLFHRATLMGDKKAQCIALTVPLQYAFHHKLDDEFQKAAERIEKTALETGYTQYYYYAVGNTINYMLNQKRSYAAMIYLEEKQQEAIKKNNKFGIYTCMKSFGQIYFYRINLDRAKDAYLKAYEFGKVNCPEQDMSTNLRQLAELENSLDNYKEALDYANRGLEITKTDQTRELLTLEKAYALGMLGYKQEFYPLYEDLRNRKVRQNVSFLEDIQRLEVVKNIVDHNYTAAKAILDNKLNEFNRGTGDFRYISLYLYITQQQNDWKKRARLLEARYQGMIDRENNLQSTDLLEVAAKFNSSRLENERNIMALNNTKLQLANTQLTLKNSSLELGRALIAENMAKLNADNYKLNFNRKQLESRVLRDSLDKHKAQQEARDKELLIKEKEQKAQNLVGLIIFASMLLIMAVSGVYMIYRRRMSLQLEAANEQLTHNNHELRIAKEEAEQADKLKTLFMQNMSHEIRTPLNAIVGFSQLMTDMGDALSAEEKKDMSRRIKDNSDLLLTLINDILDLTSIESGKYVMSNQPVRVNEMCRSTLDTVTHRKAQGVELRMDTDVNDNFTVITDPQRVKQVLINLLTNAEKNTTEGSILLGCSSKAHPGMLTFSVTDTGIGIPSDKREEVFERFMKLDNFKQGTGLGLSICTAIVDRLGGKIWIDPDYNQGARFLFTIKAEIA